MTTTQKLTRSEELFKLSEEITPYGVHSTAHSFKAVGGKPFVTKSARNAYLENFEGETLIDFLGCFGPHIHGHSHPRINEALKKAIDHGYSYGTACESAVLLSQKITQIVPSAEKVRLVNSGTEATMVCIRLARGHTGRDKIIKFEGCYHGHADHLLVKAGSGALTHGNPDSAGVPKAFADLTIVVPYNDEAALERAFAENKDEIAGVIIEPNPGNCGFLQPRPGYLEKLRQLCTDSGTVLIFDEVMTGFRITMQGVQGYTGVTPDLTALGKIIGGGLPIGAFSGKAEIMDKISPGGPVYQAGTLSGNPLSTAAGLAAIELLEETNPYDSHQKMGQLLKNTIEATAKEKGLGVQVNQSFSMWSLFFNENPVDTFDQVMASDGELFIQFFRKALAKGVFLAPSPFETNFLSSAHEGEVIEKSAEILADCIREL